MRHTVHACAVAFASCSLIACAGSPAAPLAAPGVTLSNFRARTLGLESALCGRPGWVSYSALDELMVDFTISGGSAVGSSLYGQTSALGRTPLGPPLQMCSATADPCQARGEICVVSGDASQGTVRAVTATPWEPTTQWLLNLVTSAGISNQVAASITRTEGLPSGTQAGILQLNMEECDTVFTPGKTSCWFNPDFYGNSRIFNAYLYAYHPRISGRRLRLRVEIFTLQNRLLATSEITYDEGNQTTNTIGYNGVVTTFNAPPPPYRIVGTIRETEGASVIVETSKAITYP